jgi:diacylglycerol kinase family enzyme
VIRSDPADTFAARLPDAIVHELADDEDLGDVVAKAMDADPAPLVLGVYGGDGSVSRIAHLARTFDRPLLAMPGGTFNHFARALGIDDVDTAIEALQSGSTIAVGVAEVSSGDDEPITVLNAVSVGTYPEVIDERERRGHLGKWIGGVVAAWTALRSTEPITIVRDGRRAQVWSVFVSVGRNTPGQVATMQRGDVDGGVLDVRIHHARGSRARSVAALVFGRRTAAVLRAVRLMPPESDVERSVVREISLRVRPRPGRPSVYVHDGELVERDAAGFTLRCVAVPAGLRVYAPEPDSIP